MLPADGRVFGGRAVYGCLFFSILLSLSCPLHHSVVTTANKFRVILSTVTAVWDLVHPRILMSSMH